MFGHAAFASDDERTSLHNAELDVEPHSKSDGREPRRWISETDWTDYIREDPLVRLRPSSVVCIFRVPNLLKDAKKEAYVPRIVSLGPHHHGSAELPQMGHHKGRAMRRMMKRFNRGDSEAGEGDFAYRAMEEILKLEKEIRDSYEENIDCDGATLARMLSLDGCFILEVLTTLFGGFLEAKEREFYDPIFGEEKLQYAAFDILKDILKLENQVPLNVLQKLLELVFKSAVDIENMLLDVLMYFISVFNPFNIQKCSCPKPSEQQVHHLLGFLHTAIVSPLFNRDERVDQGECSRIFIKCCSMCTGMFQDKNKARDDIESIPCAVELRNAGIKFERCDGGIKEIKFDQDSAKISLPPICIQDSTEIVFRNLIAFEMCKPSDINYVTCYVNLMNDLIDSQEDVALLRRMGVLTNHLGSDQGVADLFNSLCKDVIFSSEEAFNALRKQNSYYKKNLRVQLAKNIQLAEKIQFAELMRDHLSSPWKALALAGAIAILLLTVVQTIFSIISVYKG